MTAHQVLQGLINGGLLGCIYAGIGLGLSLVLGVLRIVNVAHSAVLILAALVYLQLVNGAGWDPMLAIGPVIVAFYGGGLLVYQSIGQRLAREHDSTILLAFFGLMVVLESIGVLIWTTDTRNLRLGYLDTVLRFAGLNIPLSRVVAAGITLVMIALLHLFLTRSLLGRAVRGMAQDRDVATMVGIDVQRLSRHVFALGISLAAFGGTVLALVVPFSPQEHVRWLAWAFMVVILGGLGSVARTLTAGLAVGMIEALVGLAFPFQYTYMVLYTLLAISLVVRQGGIGGMTPRRI